MMLSLVKLMAGDGVMRKRKELNIIIGSNIRHLREEAKLTQEALSENLGLTPNHVSAIERGVSGISMENLLNLCQLLGISADRVLFGEPVADEDLLIARRLAALSPKQKRYAYTILSAVIDLSELSEEKHQ